MERTKVTLRTLGERYKSETPITMVTAYDATFARLFDQAGVDTLLVGDSLGNVIQGQDTTIPVTLDEIIYHTRCVARGARYAHIVADLPFLSYGTSVADGVRSAGRLMKEGLAESVKLEGGEFNAELVQRLTQIGIPVVGHLGLTPQAYHAMGGYSVQGRGDAAATQLLKDAKALQDAGAWAVVLEMVPAPLAQKVTQELRIPTIGIGAGPHTSGQVLVGYDMLGINDEFKPSFLKHFASLADVIRDAVGTYCDEVKTRSYPDDKHSFSK